MQVEKIPVAEYEKLPPQFNPTSFDAAEWVALAKAAFTQNEYGFLLRIPRAAVDEYHTVAELELAPSAS